VPTAGGLGRLRDGGGRRADSARSNMAGMNGAAFRAGSFATRRSPIFRGGVLSGGAELS